MNKNPNELIDKENARYYKISIEKANDRVGVGEIKALFQPKLYSQKEDNGQLTIIGGSTLFHGAPLLSLTSASRIVDMVFYSSPKDNKAFVNKLKSSLYSFIWVPEEDLEQYIAKSDAVLIGPGMMRWEKIRKFVNKPALPAGRQMINDKKIINGDGKRTKELTEKLLSKFPEKKWVIDAGSLQTIDAEYIPKGAVLTPNTREFEMLFGIPKNEENIRKMADKFECVIVNKGAESGVYNGYNHYNNYKIYKHIGMPQPGLTKGGTGDVTAGTIAAFSCKNDPFLAACAGTFLVKLTAKRIGEKAGNYYNADDIAKGIPETLKWCLDY